MSRELSSAALADLNAEGGEEVFLTLVEISHVTLATPIRVYSGGVDTLVSRGREFLPYAFRLELPGDSDEGPGQARLTIDNVDRLIVTTVRSISTPPTVTIEVVMADTPDTSEMSLPPMKFRDISFDLHEVSGTLTFEDIVAEPIAETITPSRFPAVFALPLALALIPIAARAVGLA